MIHEEHEGKVHFRFPSFNFAPSSQTFLRLRSYFLAHSAKNSWLDTKSDEETDQ